MSTLAQLNRRIKGWLGWFVVLAIAVVLVVYGASRDTGPLTSEQRAIALQQRLACPACQGESVFESGAPAARNIRNEITELVNAGLLTDDEIIAVINEPWNESLLLLPRADGAESLVWVLPAAGAVVLVAGLVVTFRRWSRQAAVSAPTDEDRRRVAAALVADRADRAAGAAGADRAAGTDRAAGDASADRDQADHSSTGPAVPGDAGDGRDERDG